MSRKLIVLIIGIILVCGYFFYLAFPLFLIGSPDSVFDIMNYDEERHFINVDIFDENNHSIFNKIYYLDPKESIELKREINWFPPIPSNLFTWDDGPYTFYFTLDDNIMKNLTLNPWPYETVCVWLYSNDEPIDIKIATV